MWRGGGGSGGRFGRSRGVSGRGGSLRRALRSSLEPRGGGVRRSRRAAAGEWAPCPGAGELRCKMAAARRPAHDGRRRRQLEGGCSAPFPRQRAEASCSAPTSGRWLGTGEKSTSVFVCFVSPEGILLLSKKPSAKIRWECQCARAV